MAKYSIEVFTDRGEWLVISDGGTIGRFPTAEMAFETAKKYGATLTDAGLEAEAWLIYPDGTRERIWPK